MGSVVNIATLFVFNTFRPSGQRLGWTDMLASRNRVVIIQLKGLEHSLERASPSSCCGTHRLHRAMGPAPLRWFVVLDEAHKLSFDAAPRSRSSCAKGRKFGVALIWHRSSRRTSARRVCQYCHQNCLSASAMSAVDSSSCTGKIQNAHSFGEIYQLIRSCARVRIRRFGEHGRVVRIASFVTGCCGRSSSWAC